ncbi:hypothetical protein LTR84_004668 [Exophiala bonariae]|uniref:Transcription factor domain-containing protein n=1 Tax=Exophiala bonariae TaxID=1690606 RepID=A0AAV9NRM2_9EURO|nr:hypothetical protein LTR84_004668 [Exophiala bonariae]
MPPAEITLPPKLTRAEVASIQHELNAVQSKSGTSSFKDLFSVFYSQPLVVNHHRVFDSVPSICQINSSTQCIDQSALSSTNDDSANLYYYGEEGSGNTSTDIRLQSPNSCDTPMPQLHEHSASQVARNHYRAYSEESFPLAFPLVLDMLSPSAYPQSFLDTSAPLTSANSSLNRPIEGSGYGPDSSSISTDDCQATSSPDHDLKKSYFDQDSDCYFRSIPRIEFIKAPAEQKGLIHHWITSLYLGMLPVARIDKPQHNMFMPIALAGLNSGLQQSTAEMAVFHGICAASAFNLSILKGPESHFNQLATKHRQLALYHLRQCMEKGQAKSECVWAAIITFVFQAGVLGQGGEWRAHIKGLNFAILANPHLIRNSHVAQGIYETHLCLSILGNTQSDVDLKTLWPPGLDYIGSVHGMTLSILEIVSKINNLSSVKPYPSPTILDRLEMEILLYSPESVSTQGLDGRSAKLLIHYSYIYKYATLIHFHRVIHGKMPCKLQDLVEIAIEHLESSEEIGNRPKGCIWTWPCLVISAECTTPQLQSRMLAWFDSKKRHGFKNLDGACKLSSELWRRRLLHSEDPKDLHWQSLIHETEYDVLPL